MEQRRELLFAVALLAAIHRSENFEVTSPSNVMGVVGQDTTLPCHISSTKPLANVEVQWKKIMDGQIEDIHIERQIGGEPVQKYPGRTSLPPGGIATGNVSLTLKNIQPADEGTYSCYVTSTDWSADTATVLRVAGTSDVYFEILGPQSQGLQLACRSHGWFPKPTVRWVTQNNQHLTPETAIEQDSRQLFSVLSQVTVTREEGEEVTCGILNPLVQTEKTATLHLSSAAFPSASPLLPVFCVVLVLFLLALAVGGFVFFKAKKKASKKKSSEEQALQEKGIEKATLDADRGELEKRCEALNRELEFRRARSYMEAITLDETHKHPELAVSSDWKRVQHQQDSSAPKPIIEHQLPVVVGREGFDSGHHYWEVQVQDGLDWELGVLTEAVRRSLKERSWIDLSEDGVWSLKRVKGEYWPKEAQDKMSTCTVKLSMVGLDLDLEVGTLSFYNTRAADLILEIPIEGVEGSTTLYPFLRPGIGEAGAKGKPLTINHNTDWDFPMTDFC